MQKKIFFIVIYIYIYIEQFKTQLPLKELRSFHRPSLKFEINKPITFSRVKSVKKKKLKAKDGTPMKSTKDITLKDNSKYLLLEYSVRNNIINSNIIIINSEQ